MSKVLKGMMVAVLLCGMNAFAQQEAASDSVLLVDDFSNQRAGNLGGIRKTYQRAPSRVMFSISEQAAKEGKSGLKLMYDKKAVGGPYGNGGWCGWYELLQKGSKFVDVSPYSKLTMWVKGAAGDERFVIGVADQQMAMQEDSVKSEPIGAYLPAGKVTTEWQKAEIPLDVWYIDWTLLANIVVAFEGTAMDEGEGKGTVYIDNLSFEK